MSMQQAPHFKIPDILAKSDWFTKFASTGDIRPYVFVRPDNKIAHPGSRHHLDWFPMQPIYKNPLDLQELEFAEQIYFIEERAFGAANMAMPRWVFYDCAVIPGFVAGFAMRTSKLPEAIRQLMYADPRRDPSSEWTPLSLFIIIPTMAKGQWVAHNLCSVNSILPAKDRFYGLGFLSKAFGLWYANVESCCGMTQWSNPALRLHTHYGHMEVVTAYTPVHSHAKTITYRVQVDTGCWERFFTREEDLGFLEKYQPSGFQIDPVREESMISLHKKLQKGEGPYFLSAAEIASKKLSDPLSIFQPKFA
jgi:hypothetical protein